MYPVLIQVGPFGVRALPLVLGLAVYLGAKLSATELRRRALDPAAAEDLLVPAGVAGLVGARLLYVLLFDPGWYLVHPADLLSLWSGGLAFPGALLAGLAVVLWSARRRGLRFWAFADAVAPGLAVGQAVGAVGSFLNGTAYGTPADLPWAVVFHDPRGQAPLGIPLHPSQLYDAVGYLLLFSALWLVRGRLRRTGALFLLYLAGAALLTSLDLLKGDALWIGESLLAAPVVTLAVLMGAATLWSRGQWETPRTAATSPPPSGGQEEEERGREPARHAPR